MKTNLPKKFSSLAGVVFSIASFCAPLPAGSGGIAVPDTVMRRIYNEVRTPFKYGIVVRAGPDQVVDCPAVFRHGRSWFMAYIAASHKVGYETFLAQSDDLLHWKTLGKILPFPDAGWDQWQCAGDIALQDTQWGGSYELQPYDGKFWMSYIGGRLKGYETDPLSIGMSWTTSPEKPQPWNRFPENPVLSPSQPDARDFEKLTLYRSNIIWDHGKTLGQPFVMFYNAKTKNGYERIGVAVSSDMIHWKRRGEHAVVANGEAKQRGISGDPQIVRIGETWVMFYFGTGWKPKAFDTFACSYDLTTWTKWEGPHLIEPSQPWDKTYAHKPWLIKHDGVVYHFYCAVGDDGRNIAVATSKDLRSWK